MKKPLFGKLAVLGMLFLAFLVVLFRISGLVSERMYRGSDFEREIGRSSFEAQTLAGPLLVLPYRKTVRWTEKGTDKGKPHVVEHVESEDGQRLVQPEALSVNGAVHVEKRERNVYEVFMLHTSGDISGHFRVPSRQSLEESGAEAGKVVTWEWRTPRLALGVSDPRGIREFTMKASATSLVFEPGTGIPWLEAGVSAPLALRVGEPEYVDFGGSFAVSATSSFSLLPLAGMLNLKLSGDTPDPSYFGKQLPISRSSASDRFSAEWQSTAIAAGVTDAQVNHCDPRSKCWDVTGTAFGMSVVDPAGRYLMTERTLKYASLFLLLTFGACFFIEVLKRVLVHPVQYGLVGAAQAVFYLLLLSFSEHISFAAAYLVAAFATVALLGAYGAAVLGGRARGIGFGAMMAILYGMLFAIIQSEDYALIMGSVLVFVALSVAMIATRHVNWYTLGEVAAPAAAGNDGS